MFNNYLAPTLQTVIPIVIGIFVIFILLALFFSFIPIRLWISVSLM